MKKMYIISLLSIILLAGCGQKEKHNEKYYQTIFCNNMDGVMEQSLLDRTRIDCLTDEYAIEVDFAKKWAESVGQSLYYEQMTGKKPAGAFILDDSKKDQRHLKRLKVLADKYDITIFKIDKGA
jgi:hypothetical protein